MTFSQLFKISSFLLLIVMAILIAGCENTTIESPCVLGWNNSTHYCNEFHSIERIPMPLVENNTSETNLSNFGVNSMLLNSNYSTPIYSPTLNMKNLTYNGNEVEWVYQIEKQMDEYSAKIIPCIIIKNGTRYCTE